MGCNNSSLVILLISFFLLFVGVIPIEADPSPLAPSVSEPTSVRAEPGKDSITLFWEQPEVGYITATGFSIYRSINDIDYSLLANVERDIFSYEDKTIVVGRTFYYFIRTDSDLGQSGNSLRISSTADNEPPEIDIISPDPDEYLGISDVDIVMELSDELNEITSVTYELDAHQAVEVGEVTRFTLEGLDDGSHTIVVQARDRAGNVGTFFRSFHVDTTGPSIEILEPGEGELITENGVSVLWESDDEVSGVATVEISQNSGIFKNYPGNGYLNISNLDPGPYSIEFRVRDKVGNHIISFRNFTVDTDTPYVSLKEVDEYLFTNSTIIELEWEGSDQTTDFYFETRMDFGQWELRRKDNKARLTDIEEGEHQFDVRITDAAERSSQDSVWIVVDRTEPELVIGDDMPTVVYQGTMYTEIWIINELHGTSGAYYKIDDGKFNEIVLGDPTIIEDLPHGRVKITFMAMDKAGNIGYLERTVDVDLEPPFIIDTVPNGTVSVRPDMVEVRFNEELNIGSISVDGAGDSGSFDLRGNVLEIIPERPFEFGRTYTFTVSGADTSGNVMEPKEIEIRVTDLVTLTGWVLDHEGKGLSGVLITLDDGKYTFTQEDGSYSIETRMGNITVYMTKKGFLPMSTEISARPDRDNSVRVIKLEKDDADFVTRVSSFFQDPLNLVVVGGSLVILMFISFVIFRYFDRDKLTEVDIEMDDDDSDEALYKDL